MNLIPHVIPGIVMNEAPSTVCYLCDLMSPCAVDNTPRLQCVGVHDSPSLEGRYY